METVMSTTRGEGPPPRIAIRAYDGCKDAQELDRRVGAHLLATLRAMPGFRGYSTADLGEGRVACISLLDSAANAANDHALAGPRWPPTSLACCPLIRKNWSAES